MVTRRSAGGRSLDPAEAISPLEALRAYTVLGAYSGREESSKGSLERGKLADIVVLDRDPLARDADELRAVKPVMTFVGGELRYEA